MRNLVLVAVDGSDGSQRALDYAIARAENSRAKILLSHVIEWSPYSFHTNEELAARHNRREEELGRASKQLLEPMAQHCQSHGVQAETVIAHGNTVELINQQAQEHDVAHVVIGRRGVSGVKSMLFGSVAANLVQSSTVPVTVVP
ncbi:MAG: universal stress protein [Granulosicoccaceae bacterium]